MRKLLTLLAAVIVFCGLAGSFASTATAATVRPDAPCYAGSCYNVDPQSSGCSASATTVLAHDYTAENQASFALEIRYSAACGAAWLRLTVWSGHSIGFAGSAWNPGGRSVGFSGGSGEETWTAMVPATSSTQACVGTQFYANGSWVRWYFLGCYTA